MPQEVGDIMITPEDIVCLIFQVIKSNGTFDELRRDCVTEIISKKRFQPLERLTEAIAEKYLSTLKYTPELNKNSIREELKQYLSEGYESREISNESNKILNQVFETSVIRNFELKLKCIVDECLGQTTDDPTTMNDEASGINTNNLINITTDNTDSDHHQELASDINNEAEIDSPEFEPLFSGLYNDDSYNGDISGTSGTSGTATSTVDLNSKHGLEINSNCLNSESQIPVVESSKSHEISNEQHSENDKPLCHMNQEKTYLTVKKDPLSDTKEKLPKTTNNSQCDDEGISSKQKSTCSRVQKSLSTKIRQSIKKSFRNKDNMDENHVHLLKNSKYAKSKKNNIRIIKKHDKISTNANKTDSKSYDYRSSSFSNDDQEAAEVLIAMGSIPCEVFNNDKTETEYRLTGHSNNKNITQNGDKESEISHKIKPVVKAVKNIDKPNATYNHIFRKEHLINNNDCRNDIHLKHKVKSVAVDNIKICDKNEPTDRLSKFQRKQAFEKKKFAVDSTKSSVSKKELVSSNLQINKAIKKSITEQDEKTVDTGTNKFKNTLKKKKQKRNKKLNCDSIIDAIETDKVSSKHATQPSSESALDRPSTSRGFEPILKSKASELYLGKRKCNINEDSKIKKNKSFDVVNCKNDIPPKCTIINHDALTESKIVQINRTNTKMSTNPIEKNPKTSDNSSNNNFTGFNNTEVEPCKVKLGVVASLIADSSGFIGFSPTNATPCKNRDKVYAELVKLNNEPEEFLGFSEQDVQVCSGYEHVKQHLDQTEKEIRSSAINQDQVVDGDNKTQKSQATVKVESGNIDDTQVNNQPTNCDNAKMNNGENNSDSSQWIAEQIRKYKLSPTWVILERLVDFKFTVTKRRPNSRQACKKRTRRVPKKKKPKTKKRRVIISSDED